MGYDLRSTKTDNTFRFSIWAWRPLLKIAEQHDWQPAGTTLAGDRDWCGTYYSNDGQLVRKVDARNLANALEQSLDDIPDFCTMPKELVYTSTELTQEWAEQEKNRRRWQIPEGQPVKMMYGRDYRPGMEPPDVLIMSELGEVEFSPLDEWSGVENKKYIREFIVFCQLGSFRIY